jgi:hypothetical protein
VRVFQMESSDFVSIENVSHPQLSPLLKSWHANVLSPNVGAFGSKSVP